MVKTYNIRIRKTARIRNSNLRIWESAKNAALLGLRKVLLG